MLKQRILTVAVALPLFLLALFFLSQVYWALLLGGAMLLAAWEWGRLAQFGPAGRWLFLLLVLLSCLGALLWQAFFIDGASTVQSLPSRLVPAAAAIFWIAVVPPWLAWRWRVRAKAVLALAGWLVLLPTWYALVYLQASPWRLLTVLGVVWIADIAAYFIGRRFGRRKLAAEISPGKTWEGLWGALAAVVLYWLALNTLVAVGAVAFSGWLGLLVVIVLAVLSVEGDLFESWLKRTAGLKDSGALLPGHGGVLDRIDGVTATLPFATLYFALLSAESGRLG